MCCVVCCLQSLQPREHLECNRCVCKQLPQLHHTGANGGREPPGVHKRCKKRRGECVGHHWIDVCSLLLWMYVCAACMYCRYELWMYVHTYVCMYVLRVLWACMYCGCTYVCVVCTVEVPAGCVVYMNNI